MYSVLAPCNKIDCDHAVAIWAAFYVKLFGVDARFAKNVTITKTIRSLSNLFGTPFWWSYHNTKLKEWKHCTISPQATNANLRRPAKPDDEPSNAADQVDMPGGSLPSGNSSSALSVEEKSSFAEA